MSAIHRAAAIACADGHGVRAIGQGDFPRAFHRITIEGRRNIIALHVHKCR